VVNVGRSAHFRQRGKDRLGSGFSMLEKPTRGDFTPPSFGKNRLIAGVYSLSELNEKMRNLCLLMKKVGIAMHLR
jgi:hypothetical protein